MYFNSSVTTKIRPVKKLYIINKNDLPRFVEIINTLSTEMGGILNVILLNDDKLFSKNTVAFINRHDPDVIINFSDCNNDDLYTAFKVLIVNGNDRTFDLKRLSTPLKIATSMPKMLNGEFWKGINKVYSNFDRPHSIAKILYYLNFGLIGDKYSLESTIFKDIEICSIDSVNQLLKLIGDQKNNFLYLSMGLYLSGEQISIFEKDYNRNKYYDNPTIIFGQENNLESMIYFWNTRATHSHNNIIWLPIYLIDSSQELIKSFTDYCLFTSESKEEIKDKIIKINGSIKEIDNSEYYFWSESSPWHLFEFVQNAAVSNNKLKIIHPPEKLFSNTGFNINVVLEIFNLDELFLPKSLALGKLFKNREGLPPYQFCRICAGGLALYIDHFTPFRDLPIVEELTIPDKRSIFKALFEEAGLKLQETNKTQITNQVINLIGGLNSLELFSDENVFDLLVKLTPKRTERLAKLLSKEINNSISKEELQDILLKFGEQISTLSSKSIIDTSCLLSYGSNDEKYHQLIQRLYENRILLRGRSFKCPHCSSRLWYPISSLKDDLHCYCCSNPVSLPIFVNNKASEDAFRLNELIINAVDQGVLPVLLTISLLFKQHFAIKRFIFDNDLFDKQTSKKLAEIDLIFTLGSRIGLGEIKTNWRFDEDKVKKMIDISNKINSDMVLFSTIKEKDSKDVQDLFKCLESMVLDIPAFIFTKEVLFDEDPVDLSKYFQINPQTNEFLKGPIIVSK